eukprot:TRINITY_DN1602_c0_g1_i1.p1 TRINITY_DN1602_c0_g1~~TRINITY_DN1602_c0_g1_i1.p1  ORF type:complete len:416 (+),score=77.16 TRINITY_DN1602_c0_g1_i1:110-1357(+)
MAMKAAVLFGMILSVSASTPFNPPSNPSTGSLGGHIAFRESFTAFKGLNAAFSEVTPEANLDDYEVVGDCHPKLGYHWQPKGGITPKYPLSLYYTKGGQIAGMRVDVYGKGAAQGKQVSEGYYISDGDDQWHLSVSFRGEEELCSGHTSSEPIGDRLVINQNTIAKSMPMTADEAQRLGFMPGSCMKSMGQHWLYDLEASPGTSWVSGDLLPLVTMYHPPNSDNAGSFNAFFFTTPTCQGPAHKGAEVIFSWDKVPKFVGCALSSAAMCENYCDKHCSTTPVFGKNPWESSNTEHWATMHVFFNADPLNGPTCPGFSYLKNIANVNGIAVGRTCPSNTAAPNTELLAAPDTELAFVSTDSLQADKHNQPEKNKGWLLLATCAGTLAMVCLLYTSDAADEEDSVDLGGRRIIKKKK